MLSVRCKKNGGYPSSTLTAQKESSVKRILPTPKGSRAIGVCLPRSHLRAPRPDPSLLTRRARSPTADPHLLLPIPPLFYFFFPVLLGAVTPPREPLIHSFVVLGCTLTLVPTSPTDSSGLLICSLSLSLLRLNQGSSSKPGCPDIRGGPAPHRGGGCCCSSYSTCCCCELDELLLREAASSACVRGAWQQRSN